MQFKNGTFVRSLDSRDDPALYFVVIDGDVAHVSGPCSKIAPPEAPEQTLYRLDVLLVSADAEIAAGVSEAERLAKEGTR